ncbi:hypothetical protein GO755_33720 [Spirosoma sp. HMF4905]|uniref:Uncharacterized protein n=1 Tax=Spirosoma arboris TaxID=2682092 RepID=A0A7K1SMK6_9BACT|nr:hypothetical protein [Spirosoma arboris]MVM35034.1 hypothetical protein [Spirosoma arboris]
MKTSSLFDDGRANTVSGILINWLDAIEHFYSNYKALSFLSESKAGRSYLHPQNQFIGQCPIRRINLLMLQFDKQITVLHKDIDSSTSAPSNYRLLIAHTQLLNELNRQAQELLLLAAVSND